MSADTERTPRAKPRSKQTRSLASAAVTALPQVNLLPPEIRASRSLSRTKRRLVFVVLAGILVVAGGYGYGALQQAGADSQLEDAQTVASALQVEANKYAEVTQVLAQVNQVTEARTSAMSDDVLWRSYLDAITAVLPAGVSVDTLTIAGPDTQHASSSTTADPLAVGGLGTLTLAVRTSTVPDAAALLDALVTVPGITSPQVSAVVATAAPDGTPYYTASLTAVLTSDILSHRFDATTGN